MAAAWSATATAIGGWWLLRPERYPFGPGDAGADGSLLGTVPYHVAATALVALGVLGIAVGLVLRRAHRARPIDRLGTVLAAAYAVCFGLLLPDSQALIIVAYLFVLTGSVTSGSTRSPAPPSSTEQKVTLTPAP